VRDCRRRILWFWQTFLIAYEREISMSTTSAVFRIALVLAAFTSVALAAQSDQPERVVIISLTGDWKLDGTTVVFGQRLLAQGCLFGSDGSVVLQPDKRGASAQPFICEKPSHDSSCPRGHESSRCAVPLNPRNWQTSGSGLGNIWDAVARLFTGEPEKYMVAASRGIEPALVDAVVGLQNSGVDLSPAFRELPAGQYWVKLETVNGSKPASGILALQFLPRHPAVIPASSIQPGLYRLILVDKSGAPADSDSWILITPPDKYSAASHAFLLAVQKSSTWPDAMDPSAVRALLRAYLESLSLSGSQGHP
jgi:hypothetical protein